MCLKTIGQTARCMLEKRKLIFGIGNKTAIKFQVHTVHSHMVAKSKLLRIKQKI